MPTRMSVVAIIPPGITIDAALKAMRAMGGVYPKHTLFMDNDPATGGFRILHDPSAKTAPGTSTKPVAKVALGADEPGDLITFAMLVSGRDQELGAKALGVWLAERLDEAGAANYLTYSITLPDEGGTFAVTIQRVGGRTPAERIAELEEQIAELTGARA